MKRTLLLLIYLLYASCSKSQITQYQITYVNSYLDTVTQIVIVSATTKLDTSSIVSIRRYKPPVVTPPNSQNFTLAQITDVDIPNQGRGMNDFYGKQAFPYPTDDNYSRIAWSQLQTGATTYAWDVFDNQVKAAIAAGQNFSFRIGTVDNMAAGGYVSLTGGKALYPSFLHNLMQGESVKDWSDGTWWYPCWNSPSFLSYWESFLKALADHIKSTSYNNVSFANVVDKIDIGGFGNYLGEGHMDGIKEPTGDKITDASYERIITAHINAFPNNPLILNEEVFDPRYASDNVALFAIQAKNVWGQLGFRSDHVGWFQTTNGFDKVVMNRVVSGVNILAEVTRRHMVAPCIGEPMNDVNGVTPAGGTPYQTLIDEVNFYGLTTFSNVSSSTSAAALANFTKAYKAAGFRIGITGGSIISNLLTLNWVNSGVSPTYYNWDVWIIANGVQQKSSFKLTKLLTTGVSTDQLPAGTTTISIIIKDPSGYRKPLQLAIQGRQSDGSYKIL